LEPVPLVLWCRDQDAAGVVPKSLRSLAPAYVLELQRAAIFAASPPALGFDVRRRYEM